MFERPRIKAHLDVVSVDRDKLFLIGEGEQALLEGPVANRLGPLLDGTRTVAELVADAGADLPLTEVASVLANLERAGHLAEGPVENDRTQAAWWDVAAVPVATAAANLASASVSVIAIGNAPSAPLRDALEAEGVDIASGTGALAVAVVDDYLNPELDSLNRRFHASGTPWFLARVTGIQLWIGPHIRPGASPCWACLAQRLEGNRQVERYLNRKDGEVCRVSAAAPALASTLRAGAGLVSAEVATLLAGDGSPRTGDALVTIDLARLESERHHVVRLPQCPVCGDPSTSARSDPRLALSSRRKGFTADGAHRVVRPEETYERLSKHVSSLTGAVSSLRRQTVDDNGIAYSYSSGHNFALIQDSMYFLRKNLRGRSGGKGRTDVQAKVGAICEAIERYVGVFRGDEPRRRAPYAELGDGAVHPEELLLFSARQYADRESWNAAQRTSYHIVPERLDPQRPIDWTRVWSLTNECEREVPTGYCYFGHPDIIEHFFCASDANGNAAGNTLEEAILQGLLELVERDSVALWWYNRVGRPAFDLDSLGEPYIDALREHYALLDRELWVLDLTTDLGIPAFAGCSRRLSGPSEDILLGFGAHLDPGTAVIRALTEVNQFLPAVYERNRDGTTRYWLDDPDAIAWWRTATMAGEPYVAPDPEQAPTRAKDFAAEVSDDLAEDVRVCVRRIAGAGHEVLVLDQTRPDIELDVVKVMVPGLRHFWRRLGPGRIYDVPEQLGWLGGARAEADLNPVSIFF